MRPTPERATTTLRGSLVGCGYFASNHLHGWAEVEGADIVAVCDLDRARARSCAERFGIASAYAELEAMLDGERLDFVDIVTQADTHATLVQRVAAAGVDVICQKPLAPSLAEAEAIVASASGVTMMVHENFRWQRPMRLMKEAASRIGEIFFCRIHFRSGYDVYANQPYLATDERFILYDLGVHLFDLARFFCGEAERLTCHTARVNPDIRGEDVATALLDMRSGAHVIVDLSYASKLEHETFPNTLVHLEGSTGSVVLGPEGRLTLTTPAGVEHIDASARTYPWSAPPGQAIQESVVEIQRHWVECFRSGREPETTGRDNLRTLELTFAAYASAERGETLPVGAAHPEAPQ